MASKIIRNKVSKKKRRFKEDGFDLDLSYITPRIIAMGYPSSGAEALYRNPLSEVQRFFEERHSGHYKVYNLCKEREYNILHCFPLTARFPMVDHNVCPLTRIERFCESAMRYLAEHDDNVVAVHCKAGKGRTGMLIACLLVYLGACSSPDDALKIFADKRTTNNQGVTIPSQIRFVYYFSHALHSQGLPKPEVLKLDYIRMVTVPDFDVSGGCDPYVQVLVDAFDSADENMVFDQKAHGDKIVKFRKEDRMVLLDLTAHDCFVAGNTKLVCYDFDPGKKDDKMFHLWINTGFVERNYLCFERSMLDGPHKDSSSKHFSPHFRLELFFTPITTSYETYRQAVINQDWSGIRDSERYHGVPVRQRAGTDTEAAAQRQEVSKAATEELVAIQSRRESLIAQLDIEARRPSTYTHTPAEDDQNGTKRESEGGTEAKRERGLVGAKRDQDEASHAPHLTSQSRVQAPELGDGVEVGATKHVVSHSSRAVSIPQSVPRGDSTHSAALAQNLRLSQLKLDVDNESYADGGTVLLSGPSGSPSPHRGSPFPNEAGHRNGETTQSSVAATPEGVRNSRGVASAGGNRPRLRSGERSLDLQSFV